ncbi:MAG: BBP7 family outer membrane beta-barrel protein [Planctomycetota bacterium]|nr:BBP7 family outer membrane beta-barrel protein [Planctomycetota bacterium]MDA1162868.1 BBP7 family outer membrane beta-barrel protein [Planctomycetota bacterium]
MTGRFVYYYSAVLLLAGAISAQAQGPQQWTGPTMPSYEVQIPAWYSQGGSQAPTNGWQPRTPPYQAGPANRSWDNLSGDRGWMYENSPLDDFFAAVASDSYFRLEYLNYNFDGPGNTLLGAPVLSQIDPTTPFPVTDTGGNSIGEARVATTSPIRYSDGQAIRATLGIPLIGGTLEGNIFFFSQVSNGFIIDELGAPTTGNPLDLPQFVATSTRTNGQIGNNLLLYDDSYSATMSAELWGSEGNFIFDAYLPDPMLQLHPIVGFRYLNLTEELGQIGVFDQQDNLVTPLTSRINSESRNQLYTPQIGLRVELKNRWLTLGFEPKLGVGANSYSDTVTTQSLSSDGDPFTSSTVSGSRFTAVGELNLYARLHIRQNIALSIGYSNTWLYNVTRAHSSIFYDDIPGVDANGQPFDPAIVAGPSFENFKFGGLTTSIEIRF